jgi:pyruvate/2-oxoglutarate/acetoin dehydrogenase E1 component
MTRRAFKTAIRDDGPVMCIENKKLYGKKGPVPEENTSYPSDRQTSKRGKNITS